MSNSEKLIPEVIANARMFLAFRAVTWSFIRAIRGEITMQIPSIIRAGT